MKPRLMQRREVIALDLPTLPGKVAYFAKKLQWDASWYTTDINKAKVYRHPDLASNTIRMMGESWKSCNPRIVNPRSIEDYVDIPTKAAKRQAADRAESKRIMDKLLGRDKK